MIASEWCKSLGLIGMALALAPKASAAEPARNPAPNQEQIDRAVALATCKADRPAFRTLAHELRDVASSREPSAGWQPVAREAGEYGMALGNIAGVLAEMQLTEPVLIFGHPTRRLILSRSSVVATFDDPAIGADLAKSMGIEPETRQGGPAGMRIVESTPEAEGDGIEVKALITSRIDADHGPSAVAGCLYYTQ